jgi:probable rRNA maturation factor
MLSIDWLSLTPFGINQEQLENWISFSVRNEGFSLGELAVVFCSDDELLDMNVKHLGHDYFTDIITFDYCEEEVLSGDLFISVDRVKDNAKSLGVGFETELDRVIIHGVLHLCGYDDKSDDEVVQMRIKEDFYLGKREGFT